MKRSYLLTIIFLVSLISYSFGQNTLKKIIAVIPFEAIDVAESEADLLSRELSKGFAFVPEVYPVPYEQILTAIKDTAVVKDSTCKNRACQLAIGKSVKAEIIFSGTIYKVNSRYSSLITAIDCQTNATLWSKDYSFDGDFKNFQSKVSYTAVMESRYSLFQGTKNDVPVDVSSENKISKILNEDTTYENEVVEEDEDDEDDEDSDSVKALKNGIVKSFALGINGRYNIGSTGEKESEWGLETFVLFPTSKMSHLRIKLSLPMSTADNFRELDDFKRNRDFLYSIDHEWGLGGVGITFGFAYMYMTDFTIKDDFNSSYYYDYESVNMFNWVIGIRAGYPNKGFRGRVCFPMPFVVSYYDLEEQNNFVEYSAYGMFGTDNVKGCIGVQGAFKRRIGEKKGIINNSYYSYDDENVSKREFYFMGPSTKIAFLAGQHNVISFGLEWLGLFFPDPFNEDKNWTPNINIGYTFSFSPIDRVQTFDGRM